MFNIQLRRLSQKLPISNHESISKTKCFRKHSPLMGNGTKRALIVGGSGCGKTNLLISLLLHPNGLRFSHVYIYCKTIDQQRYEILRKVLTGTTIGYNEYVDDLKVMSPTKAKKYSVMIFDDVACNRQSVIRNYFCFGRHRHIDCFYLCQTYTAIPKQLVRDNANTIVLFKQDATNLRHVYDDHVTTDMSFDQFRHVCNRCWSDDPFGFLVIDKESPLTSGRYRKGFDVYITVGR